MGDMTRGEVEKSTLLLRRIKLHGGIVLLLRVIEVCLFSFMWAQFALPVMRKSASVPIRGRKDHLVSFSSFLTF